MISAGDKMKDSMKIMRPKGWNGFTLVELLVVIAIIALLLSLLMPALGKVRNQAKEQVCKANLKQFGIGMEVYAENNRDQYPSQTAECVDNALNPTTPAGYDNWAIRLLPEVSKDYRLFKCPAALTDTSGAKVANWSKDKEKYGLMYLYNGAAAAFKRGKFDRPSEKIIVHDIGWRTFTAWTRLPTSSSGWTDSYADYPWANLRAQYKDAATCLKALASSGFKMTDTWNVHKHDKTNWGRNLVMMDGHVVWHAWGTFLDSYLPSSELGKLNYIRPREK